MKEQLFSYAGRAPKVVATQVVALFDPATGRIHHCHTVHVHKGGREVSEKEAVDAAHRHAQRMGHETAHLKVKVSTDPRHGHAPHVIDLRSGQFVARTPETMRPGHKT